MRKKRYNLNGATYTDAERYYLEGPVKQVMQTAYKAHWSEGKIIQGKIEADSSGNETNFIMTFSPKGTEILDELYGLGNHQIKTSNEQGQQIMSETYYKGQLYSKTIYTYND